ncbi:MAG: tetratricopeptide repeat protein [Candidatus Aminicenantes bacterium]|nr:tetratricopeptide repeat protein [Candidatus Aminicenantes bacterium]
MLTRKAAFGLLLLGFLAQLSGSAQEERSRLDFWKANYTELRPEDDARAAKAYEIFGRVINAAGKRAGVVPSLFIVKDAGAAVPLAIALPDGGIVISRQVLDICYKEPEKGDDRLAFVLAHEIAHQLKDDFWHLRFFQAVELSQKAKPGDAAVIEEVRTIANTSQEPLLKEMQCDEYGIVYASMAGFDTRAIVLEDDKVNFFRYFAAALDPGNIRGEARDTEHPSPDARAAAVKARLVQVLDVVDLFDLGLLFYQTGDFETASRLFSEFLRFYPGREVYHDLGASHHQIALKCYREWKGKDKDFPFKLSLTVESETRARQITLRNAPKPDWEARFKEEIAKAIEFYRTAIGQDPSFWPSANNLGCALLLQESPYEAVAVLQKALQSLPDSSLVLSNLGAAFYLAENPQKAKEKLQAALKISPAYEPALYNLGLVASLENDQDGSRKNWEVYLQIDPDSLWAGRILAKLSPGQAPKPPEAKAESAPEALSGLTIGDYTDVIPADWGTPVRKKEFLGGENPVTMSVFANGTIVVSRDDEIIRLSVSSAFRGQTAKGIALGSGQKDLMAKYGKPSGTCLSSGGEAWVYSGQGITFNLRDGEVASWILFKPA